MENFRLNLHLHEDGMFVWQQVPNPSQVQFFNRSLKTHEHGHVFFLTFSNPEVCLGGIFRGYVSGCVSRLSPQVERQNEGYVSICFGGVFRGMFRRMFLQNEKFLTLLEVEHAKKMQTHMFWLQMCLGAEAESKILSKNVVDVVCWRCRRLHQRTVVSLAAPNCLKVSCRVIAVVSIWNLASRMAKQTIYKYNELLMPTRRVQKNPQMRPFSKVGT